MRRQGVFVAFVGAILLFLLYGVMGLLSLGEEDEPLAIKVIISESSQGRWEAFREGLEMGAAEANAIIDVVSTVRFTSFEEECALVSREAASQADALIVEPVGADTTLLSEAAQGLPLVLASSSLPDSSCAFVGASGEKMGELLASEMLKDTQGAGEKIALLSGNLSQMQGQECRRALLASLKKEGLSVDWELDDKKVRSGGMLSLFMEAKGADILFCLDNEATEAAAAFLEKRERKCRLYGVGRSEKAISYLDRGIIKALLVPDEYYMGYLCVKELASKEGVMESHEVELCVAREEDMFSPGKDMILFPMAR